MARKSGRGVAGDQTGKGICTDHSAVIADNLAKLGVAALSCEMTKGKVGPSTFLVMHRQFAKDTSDKVCSCQCQCGGTRDCGGGGGGGNVA